MSGSGNVKKRTCGCIISRCLTGNCICFRAGLACANCKCERCGNTKNNETEVQRKAYVPTAVQGGCSCWQSRCATIKCSCFTKDRRCTVNCACKGCQNGRPERGGSDSSNVPGQGGAGGVSSVPGEVGSDPNRRSRFSTD